MMAQVHSPSQCHHSSPGSLSTSGVRPVQVLPVPQCQRLPLSSSPGPRPCEPPRLITPHPNPLQGVRVGEQRSDLPPPPPPPPPPSQPLLRLPPPPPPSRSRQVDDQCQVYQQLPAAFHPTTPLSQPNLTQPPQQPHDDALDPVDVGSIPDPAEDGKMTVTNIRAAMGLDKTHTHKNYYLVIRVGTLLYPFSDS